MQKTRNLERRGARAIAVTWQPTRTRSTSVGEPIPNTGRDAIAAATDSDRRIIANSWRGKAASVRSARSNARSASITVIRPDRCAVFFAANATSASDTTTMTQVLLLAAAAYLEASRLGSAELAGGTATATEIAEKLRRQLELALSAAISLRRCQPDDQGTPDGSRLGTRLRRPYRRFKTRTKRRVKEARKRAGGASKARAKTLVARRTRA